MKTSCRYYMIVTGLYLGLIPYVTGCGTVAPISENPQQIAYEHGIGRGSFRRVYEDASTRCAKRGMTARQQSSVCPERCVTNFECVK